jgi:hypothetical protein
MGMETPINHIHSSRGLLYCEHELQHNPTDLDTNLYRRENLKHRNPIYAEFF